MLLVLDIAIARIWLGPKVDLFLVVGNEPIDCGQTVLLERGDIKPSLLVHVEVNLIGLSSAILSMIDWFTALDFLSQARVARRELWRGCDGQLREGQHGCAGEEAKARSSVHLTGSKVLAFPLKPALSLPLPRGSSSLPPPLPQACTLSPISDLATLQLKKCVPRATKPARWRAREWGRDLG